jgi:hypothetical protein
LQEFRQAAQDFNFGVPASSLVGDDRILQCALSHVQKLQGQQQQDQAPGRAAQSGVLLLSNDKVMQLKVRGPALLSRQQGLQRTLRPRPTWEGLSFLCAQQAVLLGRLVLFCAH